MSLRETVRRHPEVADHEVDDVIEIATRLQDERLAAKQGVSADQIRAVAAELDIDPALVDEALQVHRQRSEDAENKAKRVKARRRVARRVGAGIVLAGLFFFASTVSSGASALAAATSNVSLTERMLMVVLQRQMDLAPQLVALTGAESPEITQLRDAFSQANTMQQRLDAAANINQALARQLGTLPPPASNAEAKLRLEVQYEIGGSQNRIANEHRRYQEALDKWDQAAATTPGRLAIALGLATRPE